MNLLRRRLHVAFDRANNIDLSRILLHARPQSDDATELRAIAQEVFANLRSFRRVAVLPIDGGQASRLLCNVAYAIGESQEKVAIIEADMRSPKIAARFRLAEDPGGLAAVLEDRIPSAAAERPISSFLTVVPAGEPAADIPGLLNQPKFSDVVKDVAERNAVTFVQCPAAMTSLDYSFIVPVCEAIVVIAHKDKSRMSTILKVRDQIERLGVPIKFALLENGRF